MQRIAGTIQAIVRAIVTIEMMEAFQIGSIARWDYNRPSQCMYEVRLTFKQRSYCVKGVANS